jgi:hypothetical protein
MKVTVLGALGRHNPKGGSAMTYDKPSAYDKWFQRVVFGCLMGLLPTAAMADQYQLVPWGASRNNLEYDAVIFDETNGDVFDCTVSTDTLQTKIDSMECVQATIRGEADPPGPVILAARPNVTAAPLRFWKVDQNGKVTFCFGPPAAFGPPHIFLCASAHTQPRIASSRADDE